MRVRDMEPAGPASWRIYATPAGGTPGIGAYRLTAGSLWRYEATIATPKPVQRIEVIDGYRDPPGSWPPGAEAPATWRWPTALFTSRAAPGRDNPGNHAG
ncbi:hypothetical protein Aau02nite_01240 [Amorphoplanes auranticolor]|uniref:Uncharacterized protein n=1 Tax=Actinoplanes auranticolor TaxID=47988 RepID=A0A919VG00_9ACTN|nr:hypothetical protein Aau02nite_01240 [Actinoplanes auranticolor]